jgi:hypothetical protein
MSFSLNVDPEPGLLARNSSNTPGEVGKIFHAVFKAKPL